MGAVTFGELLDQGRGHLDACVTVPDSALREYTVARAAVAAGRMALTWSRLLADVAPYGIAEAITGASLDPAARAAVDAREALRLAAAGLRADGPFSGYAEQEADDAVAGRLAAAGTALAAGRDLLRTHFVTDAQGELLPRSDWSAVITSAPLTWAILEEAARWSQQLGLMSVRLAAAAFADPATPAAVSQRLAEGCRGLLAASAAVASAPRDRPGGSGSAELLHAVPAWFPPERQPPGDAESAAELAGGVAVSAARIRVITRALARGEAWSPAMTADSWRWTATGAAVICNVSEIMLTTLARQHGPSAATSPAAG